MFNHLIRRARKHTWELAIAAVEKIPTLDPDVVVCSGDLSTISAPREFEQAIQTLHPLIDDTSFELLYVPGNHDHYTHDPVSVKHLQQAFQTMNRGRWQVDELPLAHTFEGVEFLLVNEARPEPPYSSAGGVTPVAQEWLQQWFAGLAGATPVCMVHHYPLYDEQGRELAWRRRSHGNEVMQQALRDGTAQLSLCGHIHEPYAREEAGGGIEFCAGSVTACASITVIEFDPASKAISWELVDVSVADGK